jgi:predicted GIY-YIG superfamily endonuclease
MDLWPAILVAVVAVCLYLVVIRLSFPQVHTPQKSKRQAHGDSAGREFPELSTQDAPIGVADKLRAPGGANESIQMQAIYNSIHALYGRRLGQATRPPESTASSRPNAEKGAHFTLRDSFTQMGRWVTDASQQIEQRGTYYRGPAPSRQRSRKRDSGQRRRRYRKLVPWYARGSHNYSRQRNGKTVLYRFYNSQGSLLYIGITNNFDARLRQHLRDKPWAGQIARKTITTYATRQAALNAEVQAIRRERPRHNIEHNRGLMGGQRLWRQ